MTELGRVLIEQNENSKIIDSIGFLLDNLELKILDKITGRVLGPNEDGELCLRSPVVMIGYYENPEAKKEMIDDEGIVECPLLNLYSKNIKHLNIAHS